jgi:hypothetical protein
MWMDHPAARLKFQQAIEYLSARRVTQCLEHLWCAERLGHSPDECASHRWFCWMLLGDFERAWRESDALDAHIDMRAEAGAERLWDGLPCDGKRVIVRCLHGYGDAIQFLRYAKPLRSRASRVIVETHPEMVSLVEKIAAVDEAITWGDGSSKNFTAWDQQIEVMELPRMFRTTVDTIPSVIPYVHVSHAARKRSLDLLGGPSRRPKVGVLWASSDWNIARCVPFVEFSRILSVPRLEFYSFQRGPRRSDLALLNGRVAVQDTAEHSPCIIDTAADLLNMDLLIAADTMAVHLAGALGRPVWTLLPYEADWRWMLKREDTPWYPSMRLLRQTAAGDWASVIDRVVLELTRTGCNKQALAFNRIG